MAILEHLNERFRPLEDETTGTRVGTGIATGADRVFSTDDSNAVESERLLKLSMARDTLTGKLVWGGNYLVDPWNEHGDLVDLDAYPRLRAYLQKHAAVLRRRYIAARDPGRWYKTIDKVDYRLTARPKLLLPDMSRRTRRPQRLWTERFPRLKETPPVTEDPGKVQHPVQFAVDAFWEMRNQAGRRRLEIGKIDVGGRGKVTAGQRMAKLEEIIIGEFVKTGIPQTRTDG